MCDVNVIVDVPMYEWYVCEQMCMWILCSMKGVECLYVYIYICVHVCDMCGFVCTQSGFVYVYKYVYVYMHLRIYVLIHHALYLL